MSVETVISIIEETVSATSSSSVRVAAMSVAELLAMARGPNALNFFKNLPYETARWIERIKYLRNVNPVYLEKLPSMLGRSTAFESAMAKIAAEEAFVAHSAKIATANAAASAAEGTLVAGAGTTAAAIVLPVVAMVAVQVALGAGIYLAREQVKKEGFKTGFGIGFITGLLQWELRFAIDRFWDNAVSKNAFDEMMPAIRANSYNKGLMAGRVAAVAKTDAEKQSCLRGLRKLTVVSAANWTSRSDDWMEQMRARQVQISYVIELASAARKHQIIRDE